MGKRWQVCDCGVYSLAQRNTTVRNNSNIYTVLPGNGTLGKDRAESVGQSWDGKGRENDVKVRAFYVGAGHKKGLSQEDDMQET